MEEREKVKWSGAVDSLVMSLMEKECYTYALEVAEKLGASPEIIEYMIRFFVAKGWIDEAARAARLGRPGGKLTAEEISLLLHPLIQGRLIPKIKIIGKRVADVIDELVEFLIHLTQKEDNYRALYLALNIARLGASQIILDRLVRISVEKGFFDAALRAVEEGASIEAAEFLLDCLIKDGSIGRVLALIELIGRQLTVEEIMALEESVEKKI